MIAWNDKMSLVKGITQRRNSKVNQFWMELPKEGTQKLACFEWRMELPKEGTQRLTCFWKKNECFEWMDRMELGRQLGDYLVECCWTDRWLFLSNNEREDLILAKGDGELGPGSGRLCSGLHVGTGDRLYQRWEGSQQSQDLWGDLRDPSGRGPAQGSRSHKSLKLFTKGPEGGGVIEGRGKQESCGGNKVSSKMSAPQGRREVSTSVQTW